MAIAALDPYGAAPGLAPLDRIRPNDPPPAPATVEETAPNERAAVVQTAPPPAAEIPRSESLAASARAASVALDAATRATDETDRADETAAAVARDAAELEAAEAEDEAALAPIDASAPSAVDVAQSFEAVAALVPTEQTLAPPVYDDEDGLSAVGAVDRDERTRAAPGELLSRFA